MVCSFRQKSCREVHELADTSLETVRLSLLDAETADSRGANEPTCRMKHKYDLFAVVDHASDSCANARDVVVHG